MPGTVFRWREGARMTVDAQMAGEHIEHLRKQANGQLTPAQVVDDARDERALLHPAFEWDDSVAAERHREDQARHLIGCIIVSVKPRGIQRDVRAFVNVTTEAGGQGYTSLPVAMRDEDLRAQILVRAWEELQAWQKRYESYLELAEVHEAIDTAAAKLKQRRA